MNLQNIQWVRGQDEEWTLTITDDLNQPVNLTTAQKLEFEVKDEFNDADPALLHLDLLGGLTLRDQNTQPGVVDLLALAAQTYALPEGDITYDVFVTRSDGKRKCTTRGTLTVLSPDNTPP